MVAGAITQSGESTFAKQQGELMLRLQQKSWCSCLPPDLDRMVVTSGPPLEAGSRDQAVWCKAAGSGLPNPTPAGGGKTLDWEENGNPSGTDAGCRMTDDGWYTGRSSVRRQPRNPAGVSTGLAGCQLSVTQPSANFSRNVA